MESCQRRLSGGYITLLFSVAAGTDAGRELLANTGLWNHLASMGNQVGRVINTTLCAVQLLVEDTLKIKAEITCVPRFFGIRIRSNVNLGTTVE